MPNSSLFLPHAKMNLNKGFCLSLPELGLSFTPFNVVSPRRRFVLRLFPQQNNELCKTFAFDFMYNCFMREFLEFIYFFWFFFNIRHYLVLLTVKTVTYSKWKNENNFKIRKQLKYPKLQSGRVFSLKIRRNSGDLEILQEVKLLEVAVCNIVQNFYYYKIPFNHEHLIMFKLLCKWWDLFVRALHVWFKVVHLRYCLKMFQIRTHIYNLHALCRVVG